MVERIQAFVTSSQRQERGKQGMKTAVTGVAGHLSQTTMMQPLANAVKAAGAKYIIFTNAPRATMMLAS